MSLLSDAKGAEKLKGIKFPSREDVDSSSGGFKIDVKVQEDDIISNKDDVEKISSNAGTKEDDSTNKNVSKKEESKTIKRKNKKEEKNTKPKPKSKKESLIEVKEAFQKAADKFEEISIDDFHSKFGEDAKPTLNTNLKAKILESIDYIHNEHIDFVDNVTKKKFLDIQEVVFRMIKPENKKKYYIVIDKDGNKMSHVVDENELEKTSEEEKKDNPKIDSKEIEKDEAKDDIFNVNFPINFSEKAGENPEDVLLNNITEARKIYAQAEYKDRKAINRINKFLKLNLFKKGEGDTANILEAQRLYEDALEKYREFKIEQFKREQNISKDAISDFIMYFNYKVHKNLFDEKRQAKIDDMKEKGGFWNGVSLLVDNIAQGYNKNVPLSAKVALSATAFVTTGSAFAMGKRIFGSFMLMATGDMMIDGAVSGIEKIVSKKESKKIIEKNTVKEGEINYDAIGDLLKEKIANSDRKLNNKSLVSLGGKVATGVFATIFGLEATKGLAFALENGNLADAGSFGKMMKNLAAGILNGEGDSADNISNTISANGGSINGNGIYQNDLANEIDPEKIFKGDLASESSLTPNADLFEGKEKSFSDAINNAGEKIVENQGKIIEVVSGSSFEGSIIKYLDSVEPGVNHGGSAHLIFNNAAENYAKEHNISFEKAVAKLSRIREGSSFSLVKNGSEWRMNLDDQNIKFAKGIKKVVRHSLEKAGEDSNFSKADILKGGNAVSFDDLTKNTSENNAEVPYSANGDFQKIENQMEIENEIANAKDSYRTAADVALGNPIDPNDVNAGRIAEEIKNAASETPARDTMAMGQEYMGRYDEQIKKLTTMLGYTSAEDLPWKGSHSISELLNDGAGSKQILKSSLENITIEHQNKLTYWTEIKNKPFYQVALDENGKMKSGFGRVFNQFENIIGQKAIPLFEKNETTGQWLSRLTKLAINSKK